MKAGLGILFSVTMLGSMIYACVSSTRLATINLDETLFNRLSEAALQKHFADGSRFDLHQADLNDGYIRIVGEFRPVAGAAQEEVLNLSLSVVEGQLQGDLNVEGVHGAPIMMPEVIDEFNQRMIAAIVDYVSQERTGLTFVSALVSQDVIRLEVRFLP